MPAGEHRHGEAVDGQRRAVRRPVDAVGAAGDHRDVALGQPGRQFRRRRARRSVVDARVPTTAAARCATSSSRAGPQRPQHQRRTGACGRGRGAAPPNAANASSGHSSSSGVTSRPPRRASSSRSSAAQSISRRASVRRARSSSTVPAGPARPPRPARHGAPGRRVRRKAARPPATGRPMRAARRRRVSSSSPCPRLQESAKSPSSPARDRGVVSYPPHAGPQRTERPVILDLPMVYSVSERPKSPAQPVDRGAHRCSPG